MPIADIITGLSSIIGPSGAEGSAARLVMELLGDYMPVATDALGNVIAGIDGKDNREHILLDAHIDEIGLVVTGVDNKGFLHVDQCGGTDRRVMPGAEVYVMGKRKLSGVICSIPPHLSEKDSKIPELKRTYIDVGFSAEKTRELVPIGSRAVLKSRPVSLLGERFSGKSLDNRAGAAALIRTVELLEHELGHLPCRLTVLLSTREEVGCQGAATAAYATNPTQAVAVDVGFAMQPGVAREKCGDMGKGPMIAAAPVLDWRITTRLREIASLKEIPWQHDILGGKTGTNADLIAVARGGVRCGLVSIPQRNMHTSAEVVDLTDIENTARLLAEYVRSGGVPLA